MKPWKWMFACALLVGSAFAVAQPVAPLQSIAALDVPRYLGRWYEIAKFPNRFQKNVWPILRQPTACCPGAACGC